MYVPAVNCIFRIFFIFLVYTGHTCHPNLRRGYLFLSFIWYDLWSFSGQHLNLPEPEALTICRGESYVYGRQSHAKKSENSIHEG